MYKFLPQIIKLEKPQLHKPFYPLIYSYYAVIAAVYLIQFQAAKN